MAATLSLNTWINKLSSIEKVELMEQIWDTIDPNDLPVPEWHKDLIDKSIKEFEENPNSGIPLNELNQKIKNKYGF